MLTDNREHAGGAGVVVLTYEAETGLLQRCLDSIVDQWRCSTRPDQVVSAAPPETFGAQPAPDVIAAEPILDILVADNGSPTLEDPTRQLVEKLAAASGAPLRFLPLGNNFGFAGGINRGIRALKPAVDLVFLLNPDAELEPRAIDLCATALRRQAPTTVSAAPKMLLSRSVHREPTIDAIANAVNSKAEAFNIGLGQPDLGQYDTPAFCFGPCFGAALLRRDAFREDQVGELDETLFLYYEDVEWNWRAQIFGFRSITVPEARVRHVMSASTRHLPYDFKFRLTERNLLIVALMCVPGFRAYRIVARRMIGLAIGSVRGHYPTAGWRAILGVAVRLPRVLGRRRSVKRRRQRSHDEILAFGEGERIFFDSVRYEPTEPQRSREFAMARLQRKSSPGRPTTLSPRPDPGQCITES